MNERVGTVDEAPPQQQRVAGPPQATIDGPQPTVTGAAAPNGQLAQQLAAGNPAAAGLPGLESGGNQAVRKLAEGPASGTGAVPVLFGVEGGTRRIYASVTVPGHSVEEISGYLYGTPERAAEIGRINGIGAAAPAGTNLVLPDGQLTASAKRAVDQALADGTALRPAGLSSGGDDDGRVFEFDGGGQHFALTEGQLRGMAQGKATWISRHAARIHATAEGGKQLHEQHLADTNGAVRAVSDWFADQDELSPGVWVDAISRAAALMSELDGFDATTGDPVQVAHLVGARAAALAGAADALDRAETAWDRYIDGTVRGGETAVRRLELVRDMSFLIASGLAGTVVGLAVAGSYGGALAGAGVAGATRTVVAGTAAVASGAVAGGTMNATMNSAFPAPTDAREPGRRAGEEFVRGARSGGFGALGGMVQPAVGNAFSQRLYGMSHSALPTAGQRIAMNVASDAVVGLPLGAAGSAWANAADLASGKIDTDEYLSRIRWALVRGLIIGAFFSTVLAPARAAVAKRPADASEADVVYQPPQVDRSTGTVTQVALHRPSGQILQATYNPANGNGQVVNTQTGEVVAVISNGTMTPTTPTALSSAR